MVAVCKVGNVESLLMGTSLSETKLWNRPAESLSSVELIAFLYKMKHEGSGHEARAYVDLLLNELDRAHARGEISAPPLLPSQALSITTGEVRQTLQEFSLMRRKALLFAIYNSMTIGEAVSLSWGEALALDLSDAARGVLRAVPRHIFCERVFWEQGVKHALPLYGLQAEYSALVQDISWAEFAEAARNAIPYDYEAERAKLDSFMGDQK